MFQPLWIKHPKKKLRQGTLLFNDLFPESKPGYLALTTPVTDENILDFHLSLMDDHNCNTVWVISPTLKVDDKSGLPPFTPGHSASGQACFEKEIEMVRREHTRSKKQPTLV